MYIDPIHAGPVALAHAIILANRANAQFGTQGQTQTSTAVVPRATNSWWLRLTNGWRRLDDPQGLPAGDPVQLMLLSEASGRPYATALCSVLLINHLRRRRAASQSPKRSAVEDR
jgi:hypothetical protein